jgi:S-methyl-5-thioribose-1-phosphate isomerase
MLVNGKHYRTIWMEGSIVCMINQLKLPHFFEIFRSANHLETANAIKTMIIRGAPAIGAAGAYGVAQACLEAKKDNFSSYVKRAADLIKLTRPTAQDLFYAVDRVYSEVGNAKTPESARKIAVAEAEALADESSKACMKIGEYGSKLIKSDSKILTHCNAGWLATVDWGTAISPIYFAKRQGKKLFVFADETRPRCQGAKLTAWELVNEKIPHAVIADNAAGHYMQRGEIDLVITGADRIARNGDAANKIGTYEKAVLAKENGIPFYIASPLSTFDLKIKNGGQIPIEERSESEVLCAEGLGNMSQIQRVAIAPLTSRAKNPAFDVTPAKYIKGIITEKGIIKPTESEILSLFKTSRKK